MKNRVVFGVTCLSLLIVSLISFSDERSAIDDEVGALKGEVVNSKTQMMILKELTKKEGIDSQSRRVLITFKNEMGDPAFFAFQPKPFVLQIRLKAAFGFIVSVRHVVT